MWQFALLASSALLQNLVQLLEWIQDDLLTWGGNVDAGGNGLTNAQFVALNPGALVGTQFTVTSASWASTGGGQITYGFAAGTFQIQAGQYVTISGASPSGYNLVLVPVVSSTSTSIVVAAPTNPGTWSSGGTIQVGGMNPATGAIQTDPYGNVWQYDGSVWVVLQKVKSTTYTLTGSSPYENIPLGNETLIQLIGPTGAYSLGGFVPPAGAPANWRVTVMDGTGHVMTFVYMDSGSSAGNKIFIPSGSNFVCSHPYAAVDLIYDGTQWRLFAPSST
jgi:hypothetical protein